MQKQHEPTPLFSGLKLPANIEAERALLGALLRNNKGYHRVSMMLGPVHFFDPVHRQIFDTMSRMIEAGRTADPITLRTELQHARVLDEVGGIEYIVAIASAEAIPTMAPEYARAVRECWVRRELIEAAEVLVNEAYGNGGPVDAPKIAAAAMAEIERVLGTSAEDTFTTLDTAMDAALAAMDGTTAGLSTGFRCLDMRLGGLEPGHVYVLAGRPGMGKAQPLDAKILCADGTWQAMGELRFGDDLASVDGAPNRVAAIHERGERDVFRVTLSDGRSTEVCGEHLWRVMYRDWTAPRIISTDKLAQMLTCVRYCNRLSVEAVSGHFGTSGVLPLDPYVLGALLGDGSFRGRTARLTSADPEIVNMVQARMGIGADVRRVIGSYAYSMTSGGLDRCALGRFRSAATLPAIIAELGLAGLGSEHKFIPEPYLAASRADRLDLLRGLMDTDGWAEKHASVRFSSSSRRLAEGVQTLVRSLGGSCSIVHRQPTCVVKGVSLLCAPAFICRIRHPQAETLFTLARKSRLAKRGHNATVNLNVASIVPSRRTLTRCITVTHPSALYVTDDYIVTHNSALGHQIAINAARSGVGVLELSLEMSATQLGRRTLITASGVPLAAMKNGVSQVQASRLVQARLELAGLPLTIDDAGGQTPRMIAAKARQAKRKHGLGLLMVDHLNLTRPEEGDAKHGPTHAIEKASGMMLQIAKDCAVPVLLLAQLSRGVEGRDDHRPNLGDLRQSGAIEQDAYAVGFVYREEYYLRSPPDQNSGESADKYATRMGIYRDRQDRASGKAEVIWGKVRDGEPGTDQMRFDGKTVSFSEDVLL